MGFIGELIDFLKNTINSVFNLIKDLSKSFSSKLVILEELLKTHNVELTTNQELLRFLKTGLLLNFPLKSYLFIKIPVGSYSPALLNFLTKEIYDTKILQKMDEVIYLK